MEKWTVRGRETPFGKRWDVQTPYEWTNKKTGKQERTMLVRGLVGDDEHKTERSAIEHARRKYGEQNEPDQAENNDKREREERLAVLRALDPKHPLLPEN